MDKKTTIQLLSVGLVKFLFISILIVSIVSISNSRKPAGALNKMPAISEIANSLSLIDEYDYANTEYSSSSIGGNKAERLIHPIVIQAAYRYQIDPALVKAIIMAESGYNARAISNKGAKGLMQLMPATAQALGVEDVFNPKQNISGGVRYFKQLITQFDGDVKLALAAYNAGSRNVRHYQGVPPFKATRFYIKKVFKYYEIYKDQMIGGMDKA
ncbi:MAG: lytic transglycosylase domain-containing protein [Thermodesulfobacteriota bacterium]|nr:lytic transglycosylase domain-containing protein [Thermodesulfobacteriota bacterium]